MQSFVQTISLALFCLVLAACQSAYYGAWEKVGVHKRDILVDRVEDAREAQEDGQKQFKSALAEFKSVTAFDGGDLEKRYEALESEYEASERAATEIRDRIDAVDNVAKALFKEWRAELKEYTNPRLKADSERQLKATESRYRELLAAMKNAERSIDPVLGALKDHVLYLKHNLNARAIASLQGEVRTIDRDVDKLIADMQRAIQEADRFLAQLGQ
ncbi:MAG: DNA repair protein [Porticoccaceae bacterium]|nr:DNA repair protein [Porticoccaceae bacterium]